jgi:hypothetical protein
MQPSTNPWALNPHVSEFLALEYPGAKILELGGGTGSPYLHHLNSDVLTVEHDPDWITYLEGMGCRYLAVPLEAGWYLPSKELGQAMAAAQVIVVDGPPGRKRVNFMQHLHRVPPGCVVVLDDAHRPEIANLEDHARDNLGWLPVEAFHDGRRRAVLLQKPHRP